jgi:hypothetical protein
LFSAYSNEAVAFSQNAVVVSRYSISGYMRNTFGAGISGVSVKLSGSAAGSVTTGSNGYYQFANLSAGGYQISVAKSGYKFYPATLNYTALSGNLVDQNSTGKRGYYIRGTVQNSAGTGVSKAMVLLTGADTLSVTTDDNGNYEFVDLDEENGYVVTASKDGYNFDPPVRSTSTLSGSLDNWNFMATYMKTMSAGEMKVLGSAAGRGTVNPDKGETARIYIKGSKTGKYELRIFTLQGELIWEDNKDNVREDVFEWLPRDMASGTYIARITGPSFDARKKIIVVR